MLNFNISYQDRTVSVSKLCHNSTVCRVRLVSQQLFWLDCVSPNKLCQYVFSAHGKSLKSLTLHCLRSTSTQLVNTTKQLLDYEFEISNAWKLTRAQPESTIMQ